MTDFLDNVTDLDYETKAITVRAAVNYLHTHDFWRLFKMEYKDIEGNTTTLLPADADPEVAVFDMMNHMRPTAIYMQNTPPTAQTNNRIEVDFAFTFEDWWIRRAQTYGWLNDMLNRRDYDPLENYDRKEDGGWKDTTDVGARSGTDVKGSATNTETDTPGVTETTVSTPRVEETVTETPNTTRERTTTPGVTETVTETPNTTRELTTAPGVTETVTETPAVIDTTVETPRVAVQTVSTPGVTTKTSKSVFGDNSSTAVPLEETTVGPVGGGSDTTTVTPTTGTNQTQVSHSGTNQTVTGRTGEDVETETMNGTNQTVTEHEGEDVETETMTGSNTTVTSKTGTDQIQTTRSGSNTKQTVEGQRSDSHTEAAAQDVVTRLYQQYRVHGNIGVTAVSDMLSKELGLRRGLDLVKMAINEFLDLYTFYLA